MIHEQVLEFGTPIPYDYVKNEEEMTRLRSYHRFNQDIPGAIELVHPNKFLPSKYPINFKIKGYSGLTKRCLGKLKVKLEISHRMQEEDIFFCRMDTTNHVLRDDA